MPWIVQRRRRTLRGPAVRRSDASTPRRRPAGSSPAMPRSSRSCGLGGIRISPRARHRAALSRKSVWCNDETKLPLSRVAIPLQWRFDPPRCRATWFDHFHRLGRRSRDRPADERPRQRWPQNARAARLVVYAPARMIRRPRARDAQTDAFNRAADGWIATGCAFMAPAAAFSCTMRLTRRGPRALAPCDACHDDRAASRSAASSTSRRSSANARLVGRATRRSTGSTSTRRRSTASIPRPATQRAMPMPASIGCFALRTAGGFIVALRGGIWLARRRRHDRPQESPTRRTIPRIIASTTGAATAPGRFFAGT